MGMVLGATLILGVAAPGQAQRATEQASSQGARSATQRPGPTLSNAQPRAQATEVAAARTPAARTRAPQADARRGADRPVGRDVAPRARFATASAAAPFLLPDAGGLFETAAAAPPRPVARNAVAGLPQPLAPSDAARLVRVFDMQSRGDLAGAAREAERLDDRRLMSHVQSDRWLRAPHSAPLPEVQAWLADNPDHPDGPALHAVLLRRQPRAAAPAPAPMPDMLAMAAAIAPEDRAPPAPAMARNPGLERAVRERARDGDASGALQMIARARGLAPDAAALLQGEVALVLFQNGQDEAAMALAMDATRGAPGHGGPAFVAGLAAFAMGRADLAIPYFETTARADLAPPSLRAAGAYWTARSVVRARRPGQHIAWLLQAAQEPRTFYGLLARRALGLAPGFAWDNDVAGEMEARALAETASGWRALALLQIGQRDRAEAELRRLWSVAAGNPALGRAMLAVASQANMPELAAQLASVVQGADGRPRDFARFPIPRLEPLGGYRVDPSLLYALARQESNFEPGAISSAGARGLMQLMPATAAYVVGDPSLRGRGGHQRLHDPAFSLEVGQRYLHYLTTHSAVEGDLLRLLASYNAGPGNVGRWTTHGRHRDDPLLFIESIPAAETRGFVQRVMAYSWIYASRLGLPSPSLDRLAEGRFPRFATPEEVQRMLSRSQRVAMN